MNVLRTMNSLSTSFWIVPASFAAGTPCSSAATMKKAITGSTAPFMVMDTLILSSGMPAKRIFMSSTVGTGTPAMPTSPSTRSLSLSKPRCVARSKATLSPCCPAARFLR